MQRFSSPPSQEQQSPFGSYPPSYQDQPWPDFPGSPSHSGYSSLESQSRSTQKNTIKYELIFSIALVGSALLESAIGSPLLQFVLQRDSSQAYTNLFMLAMTAVFVLIDWSIYFFVGLLTAQRAQRASAARIACLWASLCYFVAYCLILGYNMLISLPIVAQAGNMAFYLTITCIGIALTLIVKMGLGIGIGALGGLLGHHLARKQVSRK